MNLLRNGEPNNHRRREDHPDWKMAAPRWVLVVIAGAGFWLGYQNLRTIVLRVEATAGEVSKLKMRADDGDSDRDKMAIQIAQVRVDSLRFQIFQLSQKGQSDFLDDTRSRLRDAEQELNLLKRQSGAYEN